jgi:hypothetical protein
LATRKKSQSVTTFSAAEQKKILAARAKARDDVTWMAKTFVKTQDPQAADHVRDWPTDWEFLDHLLREFAKASTLVVHKSRQMLVSWALCVYAIWLAGFKPGRQVMIQSEKQAKSEALIDRCNFILAHFPTWLLECSYTPGAQQITFEHAAGESWIVAVPSGEDQIRSFSPTAVIFDESAWQRRIKQAHESALPAVRSGGQLIHVSSPGLADTLEGEFFRWLVEKCDAIKKIHLHYSMIPGYDEKWAKKVRKEGGYDEETWEREMEGRMTTGSGTPVFKPPFDKSTNVTPLGYNPLLPLIRGWDYGVRFASCVWMQVHPKTKQILVLDSTTTSNLSLSGHIDHCTLRQSQLCSGRIIARQMLRDYDDPAGNQRVSTGPSCRKLMNERGIFPLNSGTQVRIEPSVMLLKEQLTPKIGLDGRLRPGILFDPRCTKLIEAFDGVFVTKDTDETKFSGGTTQHEIDCLRYAVAGEFALFLK